MMNEKIKELLGEELANQVTEKLGDVKLGIVNDGTLVPAEKHEGMKAELKESKTKLEDANKLIAELNDKAGLADEWKTKAVEAQKQYEEFQAETENRMSLFEKRSQTKDLISDLFPKSAIDLILDKVDYQGIELSDGKIKDADTLKTKLGEQYPDLKITTESNSHKKDEQHQSNESAGSDRLRAAMGLPPIIKKE